MRERVILAYSGGLDTTVAVAWLAETRGVEVVAVAADVGQGGDAEALRERALAAGALEAVVVDARDAPQEVQELEFRKGLIPSLPAGGRPAPMPAAGRTPRGKAASARDVVYPIKITLLDTHPPVWRRIRSVAAAGSNASGSNGSPSHSRSSSCRSWRGSAIAATKSS